jgi:hypothetical protein
VVDHDWLHPLCGGPNAPSKEAESLLRIYAFAWPRQ